MKVLILCVHDGDHQNFIKEHPEFLDLYKNHQELFIKYLYLERDNGATALAEAVKKNLEAQKIEVELINITDIPRGIIDLNRVESQAIREIFDFDENQELHQKLLKIYREKIKIIGNALENLPDDGIFIDIHTMIDFTPKQKVLVHPGSDAIQNYIEAHTNSMNFAEKRDIEFLTAELGQDPIAHKRIHRSLNYNFEENNIQTVDNIPYWLTEDSMTASYMKKYPGKGLAIDVPINELSEKTDHIYPTLSTEKIEKLAEIISSSLIKQESLIL